ncbi:MAG: HAD-IA family hydrolase [Planctomycetota bacterium]|jgi:pyrophosphatase PpaX|nr:HAD-IA family hydrolase [Planctomycetota bacterium]
MKEYAAYLFDADGTLIDSRELIYQSFLHLNRSLGLPLPEQEVVYAMIGLPMRPQLERHMGGGLGDAEYARGFDIYNRFHMAEAARYLKVFPGVKAGLETLKSLNKRMAVVSSRSGDSLVAFMQDLGLSGYFSALISADDTLRHKPDPEPALLGLRLLSATPEETVFIGDATFDMSCGKGAGLDVAYVSWGGMDCEGWPVQPDFTAHLFQDLLPERD